MLSLRSPLLAALFLLVLSGLQQTTFAQPLVRAWGNVEGIRVDGQLMEFETSLHVVGADWSTVDHTAKEAQRPSYDRDGDTQIISTRLDSVFFTQAVTPTGRGTATVDIEATARADTNVAGAFLGIALPSEHYAGGTATLLDPASSGETEVTLDEAARNAQGEYLRATAGGLRFTSPDRQLDVTFDEPTEVVVRHDDKSENVQAYLTLLPGALEAGERTQRRFQFEAHGSIDRRPITFSVDATQPGRAFDGLGGNFRLQNPDTDPKVIDYNLNNLRVAWGRVEVPLQHWQPEEDMDPIAAAKSEGLHPEVEAAMEMAQRLAKRDIPVILADWFAPEWAIVGERTRGEELGADGKRGNALRTEKMESVHASIADYALYLKNHYGVEAAMFSFNESDLGIDVRQTAEEHATLIKELGAAFAERDLKTKMVLGDASDANQHDFIEPAMNDPETHPYIGAVSFHSWRGWDTETLQAWADAADRLNVPLIVGEGSTDAGAWRYPEIFDERSFAMSEINLYTRMLATCEPKSILQWQLTADYSILSGGGVFGNDDEPLHPTQRFWNLKQIASTPAGAFALPITSNRPFLNSAAFGDLAEGAYAVHIVNNGTERAATLTGLPDDIEQLHVYVTDEDRSMKAMATVPITDGTAEFTLEAVSFTSLFTEEQANQAQRPPNDS